MGIAWLSSALPIRIIAVIKLAPTPVNLKTILVYCSVVPHDYPPFYRVKFVRELSQHLNVVFIDLPSGFRLNKITRAPGFYFSVLVSLFRFDHSFVWEFFRPRRFNYHLLKLYLLFQKIFRGKKIILYTTSGYSDPVYKFIPFEKSIFDCPDIHSSELEKNKIWISKFNKVFTNTKLITEKIKKYNNRIKTIPSGYMGKTTFDLSQPKKPNSVLFLGGISQRLDYDLLERVIYMLPQVRFYFAGEVYLNKFYTESRDATRLKKWEKILTYPNVYFLGNLSDSKLKLTAPLFKIGLIPYLTKDTFNYYSNPIKLYDYLANAMFVVSTPLPNVARFKGSLPVYIAKTPGGFAKKIHRLLRISDREIFKYKNKIIGLYYRENLEAKVVRVLGEIKQC